MKKIMFRDIYTPGYVAFENNEYKHIHYPEMLIRYDSNFIDFKTMPSLEKFKTAANYLREFHLKNGQQHVKFYLPENEKPTKELINHFNDVAYEFGYNELYVIKPSQFPSIDDHQDIQIVAVTDGNFDVFLQLQYQQDLEFGEEFANQKVNMHKRNFRDPKFLQVMAYYQSNPAGSVDLIVSGDKVEIDGLNVLETFQKKGIGSRLQKFVMDAFPDKTVILVADGADTPKEMYKKQGYQYLGFKYEVQKVYDN
ncbi:GNAT family N-acetyltransferase [Virgibacillus phasianinus]|uniref:GNAT family N-acetyltransferase n=1 Tax=Virgibacillus phasianinus TaxID=2017483 RepID=A0A220U0N5_9BACI|nr:GNAT family N-acetyltransferase [Virgibacillus phasianinus]ASK61545.1 GNAT family N-acetyltransferase [Virgibacillus phasianinus]